MNWLCSKNFIKISKPKPRMPKLIQVPEVILKVMSLNMQYGAGPIDDEKNFMHPLHPIPKKELNANLDKIADLIEDINPDLICLQEADLASARTHFINQPQEISSRLARKKNQKPFQVITGSCVDLDQEKLQEAFDQIKLGFLMPLVRKLYDDDRFAWLFEKAGLQTKMLPPGRIKIHFGNAILVRPELPIREVKHEYFFQPSAIPIMYLNIMRRKDERKSYLRCKIDYFPRIAEKIPLYIINTHFENNEESNRVKQAKILYEKLYERSGAHKILAGDFNDRGEGSLDLLLRHPNLKYFEGLNEKRKKFASYPTWKDEPEEVFDAILASKFLEIAAYDVHPIKVSDHYAVVANVKINPDLVPKNILAQMLARSGQLLTKTP